MRRWRGSVEQPGRSSIPPEQLLRALLLQTFYTVRSERQLMQQLDYNMLFRWFVGLGIDDLFGRSDHQRPFKHNCPGLKWSSQKPPLMKLRKQLSRRYLARRLLAGRLPLFLSSMVKNIQRVHRPDRSNHLIKRSACLYSTRMPEQPLEVSSPAELLKFEERPNRRPVASVRKLVDLKVGRRPAARERHSDIQQYVCRRWILIAPHHQ
jgi:hypothetical protein